MSTMMNVDATSLELPEGFACVDVHVHLVMRLERYKRGGMVNWRM
jgi:hypothetical protein